MQFVLATAIALAIDMGSLVAPERPGVTNLGFEIAPTTIEERIDAGRVLLDAGEHAAALETLTPAAEAGDARAMAAIGLLYARGEGTTRDLAKGHLWLSAAAERDPQWHEAALTVRMHLALSGQAIPAPPQREENRRARVTPRFVTPVNSLVFPNTSRRAFARYTSGVDYSANRRAVNRNTIRGQ